MGSTSLFFSGCLSVKENIQCNEIDLSKIHEATRIKIIDINHDKKWSFTDPNWINKFGSPIENTQNSSHSFTTKNIILIDKISTLVNSYAKNNWHLPSTTAPMGSMIVVFYNDDEEIAKVMMGNNFVAMRGCNKYLYSDVIEKGENPMASIQKIRDF